MNYSVCLYGTLLAFTLACKSVNNAAVNNHAFTLLDATSQHWTAGIPNGGSGIDYYFKVKITTSHQLSFDTAWINDKSFAIFLCGRDQKEQGKDSDEKGYY